MYRNASLHIAMLEGVVKDHDIRPSLAVCAFRQEALNALHSVFAYVALGGLAKALLHLPGLVAAFPCALAIGHLAESMGLSAISAREGGHLHSPAMEQAHEIFGVGRLACAAERQIAYADYRQAEARAAQYTPIKQGIAKGHHGAVGEGDDCAKRIHRLGKGFFFLFARHTYHIYR